MLLPEHPLLDAIVLEAKFHQPLGQVKSDEELLAKLNLAADAPVSSSDEIRKHIRDMLRHSGFKPTGRSKPASEYLIKAAEQNKLGSINPAVDICNVVSLHSGLPISVFDSELAQQPFKIDVAPEGSHYIFNPSGQTMDIGGLLSVFDAEGPCANAVKDSQRTKTHVDTTHTISVIWGSKQIPDYAATVGQWYQELLEPLATVSFL